MVSESDVVYYVFHLLLDALISLNPFGPDRVLQLVLREKLFGIAVAFDNKEARVFIILLEWVLPHSSFFEL